MNLFDTVLRHDESLFKNTIALDYDFQPKLVPFREPAQEMIAQAIAPLLHQRSGRHILLHGKPGLGKTVCAIHVLRELEEKTSDVYAVYINCWKKDTPFKIACA